VMNIDGTHQFCSGFNVKGSMLAPSVQAGHRLHFRPGTWFTLY
jgi:hypothetical protein